LGAIIIKDPPGSLPDEISNMTDVLLVVSLLDLGVSSELERYGRGTLWKTSLNNKTALVNGQMNPSLDLEGGHWYRFRLIYASIRYSLQVHWDPNSNAACEMKLLAKDGVYLHQAPRNISTVYLPSGGRADVAIRCTCDKPPCVAALRSRNPTKFPGQLGVDAKKSLRFHVEQLFRKIITPGAVNLRCHERFGDGAGLETLHLASAMLPCESRGPQG